MQRFVIFTKATNADWNKPTQPFPTADAAAATVDEYCKKTPSRKIEEFAIREVKEVAVFDIVPPPTARAVLARRSDDIL